MTLITRLSQCAAAQKLLPGIALCLTLFSSHSTLASAPEGFTSICTLDENCSVEQSSLVAFGSNGHYTYKTLNGNFLCTTSTFEAPKASSNPKCLILSAEVTDISPSQASDKVVTPTIDTGLYAIISAHSGKSLTVASGDLSNDTSLVQQEFRHQDNQIWQVTNLGNGLFSIISTHNNKAIESQGWSIHDGASVQQYTWINSLNQHWEISPVVYGTYQISSRVNGQAIDLFGMNKNDGGEVFLWTFWGGPNQQWRLLPIGPTPHQSKTKNP